MNNFQKAKANQILSMYKENDIEKGGEGSRGGKVIGHTKSGKPVYEKHGHEGHQDFSAEDHKDAAELHRDKINKMPEADKYISNRTAKSKKFSLHKRGATLHSDSSKKDEPKTTEEESPYSRKNFPNYGKF